MTDPNSFAALKARSNWPNADDSATLAWLRTARASPSTRSLGPSSAARYFIGYRARPCAGRCALVTSMATINVTAGKTLLEVSRSAGISHASCLRRSRAVLDMQGEGGTGWAICRRRPAPEAITLIDRSPRQHQACCQIRPSGDLTVAVVSRPATPGPPQESFDDLKEFVAAHVRGILGDQLVEFRSSDAAIVARWLAEETAQPIALRYLAAGEFLLEGARIEFVNDRPLAAIIYTRRGRPITLFQSALGDSASLAMRGQRNGYHVPPDRRPLRLCRGIRSACR